MKKLLPLIVALLPILFACNQSKMEKFEDEGKMSKRDRMDLAWAHEKEMTKDLTTGEVPTERLLVAYNEMQNQSSNLVTGSIPNVNWVELGPKNCGGRTRTLSVDLNDPTGKTVFAGSVSGGIWKTLDITANEPNWIAINNLFGNIAVSAIVQDPLNKQNIYFSTGEGYGNTGSVRGLGIWKSADGGATWNQLLSTNNANFYFTTKMAINAAGHLYTATSTGLYKSTDAGTTFTKILGVGLATGVGNNFCYDVDIASNGDVYASMRGATLHKSINGGTSFSAALPIPAGVSNGRLEVGLAKSDANTVYILGSFSNAVGGIAVSADGGNTFTLKTEPDDADPGIPDTDFSRGQAWYDLTIEVDPTNKDAVFVGGVDIFKTSDAASSWQQVSHWYGGFGYQNVHADQHNIIYAPTGNNVAYFVNDGGVYRTDNATATIPTLVGKEINYNTAQFYSCAINPTAGAFSFMAGAQDNGTHKLSVNGISNSTEVTGGDGMFCHIDQNEPQYWFSSYVYNNYYRSTNGGNSFGTISGGNNRGRFVNPTDYDNLSNVLYSADSLNSFGRINNVTVSNTYEVVQAPQFLGGTVSCITVSPNTSNRVFFGTGGGRILKVDNANSAAPTFTSISTGLPAAYLSCIEVETGNDNHMIAVFSNYGVNSIWETTNGGVSWTSIEGNLPDMPIRWALFNPANSAQMLIATELGVWSTDLLNGTSTNWEASNNGLANCRVDMLQIRQSDNLVIAATYGRGLFYTGVFVSFIADFNVASQVIYVNRALKFNNVSIGATSYAWNFGDGTSSTEASPTKKYTTPGVYTVTLSINNGASTKVKTITVLPNKFTPYLIANGGDFETNINDFAAENITGTKWERGASAVAAKSGVNSGASAWVTGIVGNYVDNSATYLYTPNYNFASLGTYDFSFYLKGKVELDYDGLILEYSTDTGKVWQPLGSTVQANWYNFANATGGTAFNTGQAFFTGTQAAFAKKNYNVSFLAGNTNVAFRFVFKSDGGAVDAGIVVDDVEVTGPPSVQFLFTLEKQNKDALLKWSTIGINATRFVIERSWDGLNFADIATVNAQPISTSVQTYSYVDYLSNIPKWLSNTTHYRVRSINNNSTVTRTNILFLTWDNVNIVPLSVTPNPFVSSFNINTLNKILDVSLVASNGQIVYSSKNVLNNSLFIPNYIANGTYFLRINTDKGLFVEKVIKIGG
jgi:PKD repeat protein